MCRGAAACGLAEAELYVLGGGLGTPGPALRMRPLTLVPSLRSRVRSSMNTGQAAASTPASTNSCSPNRAVKQCSFRGTRHIKPHSEWFA